jgi:hypothetical protein
MYDIRAQSDQKLQNTCCTLRIKDLVGYRATKPRQIDHTTPMALRGDVIADRHDIRLDATMRRRIRPQQHHMHNACSRLTWHCPNRLIGHWTPALHSQKAMNAIEVATDKPNGVVANPQAEKPK